MGSWFSHHKHTDDHKPVGSAPVHHDNSNTTTGQYMFKNTTHVTSPHMGIIDIAKNYEHMILDAPKNHDLDIQGINMSGKHSRVDIELVNLQLNN